MGGRQIRPARVLQTRTAELKRAVVIGKKETTPAWVNIMAQVPPSETLVRGLPVKHQMPKANATKPKKIYRPQRISYPEDALRKIFYKDHPWELARPKIIVETDGKDYQYVDWSKGVRQPGMPLSGEW